MECNDFKLSCERDRNNKEGTANAGLCCLRNGVVEGLRVEYSECRKVLLIARRAGMRGQTVEPRAKHLLDTYCPWRRQYTPTTQSQQ